MKHFIWLWAALCIPQISLAITLSEEKTLIISTPETPHIAFPHALLDTTQSRILMVYRQADRHVGTVGELWLAGFDPESLDLIFKKKIFSNAPFDPRDPTLAIWKTPSGQEKILVSFFQYNYTTRLIQQFFLIGDTAEDLSHQTPIALNAPVAKSASAAPPVEHQGSFLLPVYVIRDFFSLTSDVGIFRWMPGQNTTEYLPTAQGKNSSEYLLEPALAQAGPESWVSLFRTSPQKDGAGGLGPMKISRSDDGLKTWSPPEVLPWVGHHPRIFSRGDGLWAGFRDLSEGGSENPTGRSLLWKLGTTPPETVELMRAQPDDPQGWDCGYVSWAGDWVIYYRNDLDSTGNRKFRIAARRTYP